MMAACPNCLFSHTLPSSRKGGGNLKSAGFSQCTLHPSEDMDFYCRTCRETTCRSCIAYDRRHSQPPCEYRPMEESASACRESLRPLLGSLDKKKAEVIEKREEMERNKLKVHDGIEITEARISEYYEKLTQALQTKRRKTIQTLRSQSAEFRVREFETLQKETDSVLSHIHSLKESIETMNDEQILAHSDTLQSEITNVELRAAAIPVYSVNPPKILSIDAVMNKLDDDLPKYCCVDPDHSIVKLEREVVVNTAAHVYITLRDSTGLPCSTEQHVTLKVVPTVGSIGKCIEARVTPLSSSRYLACYTPTLTTRGVYQLSVEVNRQKICLENISVLVKCPPKQISTQIDIINNINQRGCLKSVDRHVFCLTRSESSEPLVKNIDGVSVSMAYSLELGEKSGVKQWAPDEMAIGGGSLYISDSHNHKVHQFSLSDGVYIASTGTKGSELREFNRPNGLCVAPDGSLYVCDSENHRIQVFDQDLKFLRTFGELGTDCGSFLWPSNIAITSVDGDVLVYVTELHNHRIQCLTTRGSHVRFIGRFGNRESELSRPNILHIHHSHLFVSDDRGVVVFTLSGQFVTRFATKLTRVGHYPIEGLTVSSDGFVYVYDCPHNRIVLY